MAAAAAEAPRRQWRRQLGCGSGSLVAAAAWQCRQRQLWWQLWCVAVSLACFTWLALPGLHWVQAALTAQGEDGGVGYGCRLALLVPVLEEEVPTELKVLLTLTGTLTSLLKHTTEDPTPGCLSRRGIIKMIYFKL